MNESPDTPIPSQQKKQSAALKYDSNPFTLCINGLGLLIEHARGVFIVTIIFGLLSLVGNITNTGTNPGMEDTTNYESIQRFIDTNVGLQINLPAIITVTLIVTAIVIAILAIALVLTTAYSGFVAAGAVAAREKRTITAMEALNTMADRFSTLYAAQLIATLKIIGGFFLFVIPGIRALLRYQALPYLIVSEKNLTYKDALSKSKKLYDKHLMEVFGILTVGAIIPVIGTALSSSGMALSAQQIQTYASAGRETPKTHWLNILAVVLFSALLLLAVLFTLLIIAFLFSR